jgi:hypothetical protein
MEALDSGSRPASPAATAGPRLLHRSRRRSHTAHTSRSCVEGTRRSLARVHHDARFLVGASEHVRFLTKAIEAFRDLPRIAVIVASGDRGITAQLRPLPANVRVFDRVPHAEILDAADLVVTDADAAMFHESILRLVPMLAYPRRFEQFGISSRIVFHGIGLRGHRRDDPGRIR